jgi:F-type H+-transporting ATPase subunit alpha
MQENNLSNSIEEAFAHISNASEKYVPALNPREVGNVLSIVSGIVRVSGLPGVGFEELLKFPNDIYGIAFNIDENEIGVILLGDDSKLQVGDEVERTGAVMDAPVGDALIGRVINPLGEPLDGKEKILGTKRLPIERDAPAIMDRGAVNVPLQTGLKVVDALIPIGRGQRELILGDRQTGKTAIAIDTIINQKDNNVLCIYCAIGQRASSVAKVIARLREKGAMEYTIVVVTEGNDPPGLRYIGPYAATSMAEFFMEQGRDVLIVYDDLTNHARSYRELSLLLRRPPGREAFPGDIFYIHSRLLERSTHLSKELGGGSLTALPIIETEAQNISAYIPTNLISITDGQIYLSPKLFELGILPAIDVGKSVSRVGGKAQLAAYRSVAGDLKLAYAQFEELETFARFGTQLDANTRKIIEHGKRIRACFKQPELLPMPVPEQIFILLALTNGLFDVIPMDKISEAETELCQSIKELPDEMLKGLFSDKPMDKTTKEKIIEIASKALSSFKVAKDDKEVSEPENKKEVQPEEKKTNEPQEKKTSKSEEKKTVQPEEKETTEPTEKEATKTVDKKVKE